MGIEADMTDLNSTISCRAGLKVARQVEQPRGFNVVEGKNTASDPLRRHCRMAAGRGSIKGSLEVDRTATCSDVNSRTISPSEVTRPRLKAESGSDGRAERDDERRCVRRSRTVIKSAMYGKGGRRPRGQEKDAISIVDCEARSGG